jgi:uncharacterized protein (UPF0548 family)
MAVTGTAMIAVSQMFSVQRPSDARIRRMLESQRGAGFSYPEAGATATSPPRGYNVDHERYLLGHGPAAFSRGKLAIERWEMFHNGWTHLCWPDASIESGTNVAMLARWGGLYSLNFCRIVYTTDEPRKYGFAYGTLPDHIEAGEERFVVEWLEDGSVWYDVLAFSRARHVLARIANPAIRRLQSKFRRDSGRAMQAAVAVGR